MDRFEFSLLEELAEFGPLTAVELRNSHPRVIGYGTWQGVVASLCSLERREFVRRHDPAAGIWDITDRAREVLAL